MPKKIQTIFKLQRVFLGILFVSMILFSANSAKADTSGTTNSQGPIFINEVMWQGAGKSIADEWLELYNNSDQFVTLDNYYLTDETSIGADGKPKILVKFCDSSQPQNIPCQYQIAPHGTFLISKNNKDFSYSGKESYLDVEPDIADSHLVLSNTKLQIGLYDKAGNELDIFGGTDTNGDNLDDNFAPYKPDCLINPNGGATPENLGTYCSLQREYYSRFGDSPDAWISSFAQRNLDQEGLDQDVFATPTPSGRPQISNFVLADQSYKLGTAKSFHFSYSQADSDGDFSRVDISANSGAQTLTQNLSAGQTGFSLPASSSCWNLSFLFVDEKNFSYKIDITLKCYSTNSQINFSEILSAPKDHDWDGDGFADSQDEWFELQNLSDIDYTLANWVVTKISSSSTTETAQISGTIPAGGFLVLCYKAIDYKNANYKGPCRGSAKISLNNDGETLSLYDPGGKLIDQIEVPALDYNISYSKFSEGWKKTSLPTPGAENKLPEVLPSTSDSVATSSSVVAQISQTSSEGQQANIGSGVDSEIIVEQRIIHATLASYLITNSTVLPKVEAAVMGSSDQRAQKPSKLSYNLLYFCFVLLAVVTVPTFCWGIYGIYRLE